MRAAASPTRWRKFSMSDVTHTATDSASAASTEASRVCAQARDLTVGYPGEPIVDMINFVLPYGQAIALSLIHI